MRALLGTLTGLGCAAGCWTSSPTPPARPEPTPPAPVAAAPAEPLEAGAFGGATYADGKSPGGSVGNGTGALLGGSPGGQYRIRGMVGGAAGGNGGSSGAGMAVAGHRHWSSASTAKVVNLGPDADTGRNEIRRVIAGARAQIRSCYERELQLDPTAQGQVTITFQIAPDGSVTSASGDQVLPRVGACIAAVIQGLSFPPLPGGVTVVKYPFIMTAAGG